MEWTQGNLIFKEKREREKRKSISFTIKLRVKKWRGGKNDEYHELRMEKDDNRNNDRMGNSSTDH